MQPRTSRVLVLAAVMSLLGGGPTGRDTEARAAESTRNREVQTTPAATPHRSAATVERRGVAPRERLREAFADVRPSQVPTGILLEKGALGGREVIRRHEGRPAEEALTRLQFLNAWGDLQASQITPVLSGRAALARRARRWRERVGAAPIALAVVGYDTLDTTERLRSRLDDTGRVRLHDGRLGRSRRFVAAVVQAEAVYRFNPRLVVPSDLFSSNVADAGRVSHLSVRVGPTRSLPVAFDVPFTLPSLPTENGRHELVLAFHLDGEPLVARAVFRLEGPGASTPAPTPVNAPQPCVPGVLQVGNAQVRYYDLAPVTSRIPYSDPLDGPDESPLGSVNVRVYPTSGSVEERPDGTCRVQLLHPIVAVDGFDYSNTRTQDSVWNDFGAAFLKFLLWDFDVVTVDYVNGRDWIPRNGYAIRELLVRGLDEIVDPAVLADDRLIVVGGSMGTQTSRWALRTAELDGEDHNTGLFVAVDGPFRGANIPISLHAALDWGSEVFAGLDEFLEGLNSHAAIQQLRRTRYVDGTGGTVWYQRHPRGQAYYAAVDSPSFGLPRRPRNVTLASGSGTGALQNDGSVQRLVYTDPDLWKNILGAQFGVKAYARTDFAVSHWIYDIFPWLRPAVFYGVADDRVLFNLIDLGILPGGIRKLRLALTHADYLDIAPGGYRTSPRDLLDAAADLGLEGDLLSDLEVHGFIPTFSALGVETDDVYFNPSRHADIASRVPFDSFYWEKCNRQHVEITDDALGFLVRELTAFRDVTSPPDPTYFQTPCGAPEPRDLCLGLVTWWEDPSSPRDRVPWYDGANCYVTPVPYGYTGRVAHNRYYVDTVGGACPIGVPETVDGQGRCYLGQAPKETTAFVWSGSFYYDGRD